MKKENNRRKKCEHNYQQLLNKKGKPEVWKYEGRMGSINYELFCTKCGERRTVIR